MGESNDRNQVSLKLLEITFGNPTSHSGGIEDTTLNLVKELSSMGYEITCAFCRNEAESGSEKLERVRSICMLSGKASGIRNLALLKILFNVWLFFYLIKHSRDFDAIQVNGDNGGLLTLFRRRGTVFSLPGLTILKGRSLFGGSNFLRRAIMGTIYFPSMIFELLALRFCAAAVCDNVVTEKAILDSLDPSKVFLISNSIDPVHFYPVRNQVERRALRMKLGLAESGMYAIWVGTNPFNYGLDRAIEAVLSVQSKWRLIVVGPPQTVKDDRIRYAGFLDHSALGDYYRASDVMLFPKRYQGIELAVLSAMLSGVVPILDSKFSPAYFSANEVFFVDDVADIVRMLDSLAYDPGKIEQKVQNAVARASQHLPVNCARKYDKLFRSITK